MPIKTPFFRTRRFRALLLALLYVLFVLFFTHIIVSAARDAERHQTKEQLILSTADYADDEGAPLLERLLDRVHRQPFNLVATCLFFLAIAHTLLSFKIDNFSDWLVRRSAAKGGGSGETFLSESFRFLGEVEVVFGVWVIPLLVAMTRFFDWHTTLEYLSSRDFTEPMFVVVIMMLAATKPIIRLSEDAVRMLVKLSGGSVKAWWLATLTLTPLLGSFITEPGAMTIAAVILAKQFFRLRPSSKLAYATLGLLFVNVSVGGVLTNFAAPTVLIVSKKWGWDSLFMLTTFGWKAAISIVFANLCYFYCFRSEFQRLEDRRAELEGEREERELIPFWISLSHIAFLAWIVVHSHYPVVFIGSFLLFLGFYQATLPYQFDLNMKTPILVGFFLAGLVVHGSLQGWWIGPLLEGASGAALMAFGVLLTAFNDNAGITFLATLIPSFTEELKYAIVSGAIAGGGLTVIANAPNPAGQAILAPFFLGGVSPLKLFCGALFPTVVVALCFYLLG